MLVVQNANNLSPTSRHYKISNPYIDNHCATVRMLLVRFPMGSLEFLWGVEGTEMDVLRRSPRISRKKKN